MKVENLMEEKSSFWMIPKFISLHFENTQTGYLYSLLRAKRISLVTSGKLKSYNEWFFYPEEWLKEDLRKPNSPNHILKLLKELQDAGLLEFKNDKFKPYTRRYKLNDTRFSELAKQYAQVLHEVRNDYFKKKQEEEQKTDDEMQVDDDLDPFLDWEKFNKK